MTAISVVRDASSSDTLRFRAVAGDRQAFGSTVGEAVDALMPQLAPENDSETVVVVPDFGPDRFFTAEQQQRREELTAQWRAALDANQEPPTAVQSELEQLVLAEVRAAGQRAAALLSGATK